MGWHTVELGKVAVVGAGQGAPQNRDEFSEEGIALIRAGSLELLCNGGCRESLEKVPPRTAKVRRLKTYYADTIVFAKSGMSAKKDRVYRLREPAHVVNHLATVAPTSDLDPGFLSHWFQVNKPSRLIRDDSYPSIRQSDIGALQIPLPPLPEQRRIAAILDKADALRQKRSEAIAKLDQLLQSVFLEMFGDPVTNTKGLPTTSLGEACYFFAGNSLPDYSPFVGQADGTL